MISVCVYEKILNMNLTRTCSIFLPCHTPHFWCHMNMKKRTLSIFCDTLVKSLKTGNVLKGCHRVVTPDFVERGKRSFHTQVSSCSPTSILSQEEQHSSRTCHLPQLDVPDNPDDLFRGMSTDFPCLTRK